MQGKPSSNKWVDYSDSDSSEHSSPEKTQKPKEANGQKSEPNRNGELLTKKTYVPSKQQINQQLDQLDDLDYDRIDEVWLDIFSENISYLEAQMADLSSKAKKGGNIVRVVPSKQKERWQVKVYIKIAYDWIKNGYDKGDYLSLKVSRKNFEDEGRRTPERKDRNKNKQTKKRYVDKESGKLPEKKKQEPFVGKKYTQIEFKKPEETEVNLKNKNTEQKQESKTDNKETVAPKDAQKPKILEKEKERQKEKGSQKIKLEGQVKKDIQGETAKKAKPNGSQASKKKKTGGKLKSNNPFQALLDL